jgi:hypothetical protein
MVGDSINGAGRAPELMTYLKTIKSKYEKVMWSVSSANLDHAIFGFDSLNFNPFRKNLHKVIVFGAPWEYRYSSLSNGRTGYQDYSPCPTSIFTMRVFKYVLPYFFPRQLHSKGDLYNLYQGRYHERGIRQYEPNGLGRVSYSFLGYRNDEIGLSGRTRNNVNVQVHAADESKEDSHGDIESDFFGRVKLNAHKRSSKHNEVSFGLGKS